MKKGMDTIFQFLYISLPTELDFEYYIINELYRYQAQDFNGQILAEVSALKTPRPAFAPLFTNQFGVHQNWANKVCSKVSTFLRFHITLVLKKKFY